MAVGIPPEIYWNIMDRYNQFTNRVKQTGPEQDMESVIEKFRKEFSVHGFVMETRKSRTITDSASRNAHPTTMS